MTPFPPGPRRVAGGKNQIQYKKFALFLVHKSLGLRDPPPPYPCSKACLCGTGEGVPHAHFECAPRVLAIRSAMVVTPGHLDLNTCVVTCRILDTGGLRSVRGMSDDEGSEAVSAPERQ